MAKKQDMNMVIEAKAINYARIASPVAMFETDGKGPTELEWKADILIDEDTVDAIEKKYPNLRKKMNPITPKKYKATYKVDMPDDVEGPAILKLTMPVGFEYTDKKSGEKLIGEKPQPKVLLKDDGKKARDITFEEYIGNGSQGKVILLHRATAFKNKPIDVIELGSIMLTHLVEVEQKPGQGGDGGPDLKDAFGLDDIEESDAEAPEPNEPGFDQSADDDFDDDIDDTDF